MKLAADDFGTFFETVHGNRPFAWQQELADRVCSGQGWPAALDVPTGLGKTAVLDVAVFALALQAELPVAERTARTRTFLVVDRRVIVDQAYDRARRLVKALSGDAEIMVEVSRRLELLAGPGAPPLTAARMRGGVSWASRWLASPRLPALVTGTVDQLGSRLLFRGYGVTQTMRPVDAALCGNDSVLLFDEAHLSQAFLRTVRAVSAYEALAEEPVVPGRALRTVLLSATLPRPTDGSLDDVLRCDPARETSLAARARLDAVKSTALLDVKAKGDLAPVLADLATTASARGASRVGVVCNTVALARAVFERLTPADGVDTALLIGRCREVERDRNAETWVRGRLAATEPRPEEGPVIVVATQTIEVGADLDLDALVIEACPLDALTQRLGRLNRLGHRVCTSRRGARRFDPRTGGTGLRRGNRAHMDLVRAAGVGGGRIGAVGDTGQGPGYGRRGCHDRPGRRRRARRPVVGRPGGPGVRAPARPGRARTDPRPLGPHASGPGPRPGGRTVPARAGGTARGD